MGLSTTDADAAKQRYIEDYAKEMGEEESGDYGDCPGISTMIEIEGNLAEGATAEAIAMCRQLFKEADTDGNGTISEDELKCLFRYFGEWSDEQFSLLFEDADTNCDGHLDYDEFLSYIFGEQKEQKKTSQQEDLKVAADRFIDELYRAKFFKDDEDFIMNAMDAYSSCCAETKAAEEIEEVFLKYLKEFCRVREGEEVAFRSLCEAGRVFFELSEKSGGWLPWRTKLATFIDNGYQAHILGATKERAKKDFSSQAFAVATGD